MGVPLRCKRSRNSEYQQRTSNQIAGKHTASLGLSSFPTKLTEKRGEEHLSCFRTVEVDTARDFESSFGRYRNRKIAKIFQSDIQLWTARIRKASDCCHARLLFAYKKIPSLASFVANWIVVNVASEYYVLLKLEVIYSKQLRLRNDSSGSRSR
jgi:hypothetical protein